MKFSDLGKPINILRRRPATKDAYWVDYIVRHRIREAIQRCGDIEHVSACTGISSLTLYRYCYHFSRLPSLENTALIARACGVSIDYLAGAPTFGDRMVRSLLIVRRSLSPSGLHDLWCRLVSPEIELEILQRIRMFCPFGRTAVDNRIALCSSSIKGK